MNFNDAYNFLLSFSNYPRKEYMSDPRHCAIYLKRLQLFLDILGNPEKKISHYIHVTGTSGKGSVCSILHSILEASGKKVASTYSPHPTLITERWKIGNKYMTKKEFVELVEFIKPKLDEYIRKSPYDMLSFYEVTEAIGFLWFAKNKADWAILEVACGGRFDSSNIIPYKDIAVITNIGLDHVGIIGNNKHEIAYEKAGIIKPNAQVFTTEQDKKILDIFQKECRKNKVELNKLPITNYQLLKYDINGINFKYRNTNYNLPAIGKHQIKNSILCIEIAKALGISKEKIKKGIAKIQLPIRMEVISKKPIILVDSAHNPDKIKSSVETIKKIKNKKINIVVGFSGDKNITGLVKQLSVLKPKSIACTRNTINPFRKVADPKKIAKKFKKYNPESKVEIFFDPENALNWSYKNTQKNEIILITGSVFLAGELRQKTKKLTI